MLLRNTSAYTKDLPTLGLRVYPGDEIEHDGPIAGFTPVDELDKPGKGKDTTGGAAAGGQGHHGGDDK